MTWLQLNYDLTMAWLWLGYALTITLLWHAYILLSLIFGLNSTNFKLRLSILISFKMPVLEYGKTKPALSTAISSDNKIRKCSIKERLQTDINIHKLFTTYSDSMGIKRPFRKLLRHFQFVAWIMDKLQMGDNSIQHIKYILEKYFKIYYNFIKTNII